VVSGESSDGCLPGSSNPRPFGDCPVRLSRDDEFFFERAGLGSDFSEFQAGADFREGKISDSTVDGCLSIGKCIDD
jgi:hypothetical protein